MPTYLSKIGLILIQLLITDSFLFLSLYLRTLLCEIKAGVCVNIMAGFQKEEKEREQDDTLTLG